MRWGLVAVMMLSACFDKPRRPGAGNIAYRGVFQTQDLVPNAAIMFTQAALSADDAIVVHIASQAAIDTSFQVLAPGWTFMLIGSNHASATFGAIAPDTQPAMFIVTTTSPGAAMVLLADEFTGNDPAGGTTTFDDHNESQGTGGCSVTVVPRNDGDAVWAACSSFGGNVGVGSPASPGATTNGNVAEYVLSANAGADEQLAMPLLNGPNPNPPYLITAVTIKPR
jgi:hypothetical protein